MAPSDERLRDKDESLTESNGSILPGDDQVTGGLTTCTLGSAPGPTLGNEYRKTLPICYKAEIFDSFHSFGNVAAILFSV